MMTFLRPMSLSLRLLMAASVKTRVVSWKDAADSHESVASDAFGDTHQHRATRCGLAALADDRTVGRLELDALHQRTGQELRRARLDDLHAAQHLAHDRLDVLVVDRHTLAPVHLLDLVDEVDGRHRRGPMTREDLVRDQPHPP